MARHFSFPNFDLTGNDDSEIFRVDIGTLQFGDHEFVLRMMISKKAPPHATHSVAKIERDGKIVWQFDRQRDAGHYTRLALVDDVPTITFVDQKTNRVTKTHPFTLFDRKLPLGIKTQVEFKQRAAEDLGLPAEYSAAETIFVKVDPAAKAAELAAKRKLQAEREEREAAELAKREERKAKREAVRLAVAGRERVYVRTTDGRTMFGQPVVKKEIPHLKPNRFYILVETINKDGFACEPMRVFKAVALKNKGIQMEKGGFEAVDFIDITLVAPEPTGSDIFFIYEDVFEVMLYKSKDDVDTLAAIGVESIEFVAFPVGNNGQYRVFALDGSEGKTKVFDAGLLKPYRGEERTAVA